jgi:predicted aspartyl protease
LKKILVHEEKNLCYSSKYGKGEGRMGMFKKKVKVTNSNNPKQFFEEEFWVDTGALYSFVPEDHLEKIGVEPSVKRNLMVADGRQDTRLLGFCDFQIEGLEGSIPCPVIFAPKGSLFLLGATALENFGVDADPIQKKLKPILAIIGGLPGIAVKIADKWFGESGGGRPLSPF